MHGLSLVAASGGYSSLRCSGVSLQWLLLFWSTGSRLRSFSSWGLQPLEHRFNGCGAWALLLWGMWDLPGPGIKLMSPVLAGEILITGPPGKPCILYILVLCQTGLCCLSCSVVLLNSLQPHGLSSPGSSVHGTLQTRILEWVVLPAFRGSSQSRDWTQVSHIASEFFTVWATRKAQRYWNG